MKMTITTYAPSWGVLTVKRGLAAQSSSNAFLMAATCVGSCFTAPGDPCGPGRSGGAASGDDDVSGARNDTPGICATSHTGPGAQSMRSVDARASTTTAAIQPSCLRQRQLDRRAEIT